MSKLFNQIISDENIEESYKQCMRGKSKYKTDAMIFDRDKTENIDLLIHDLVSERYEMEPYINFKVYEPKERVIFAPRFRDKLAQSMLNNVIKHIYFDAFITHSYACIDGKGTHKASETVSKFLRKAKWAYGGDAYIIKFDVSKFFYTIDRDILKALFRKKIKCKDTLWLMDKIVDSSPNEKGLPLGNITSHIFANIYMNEFDNFCKRKLGLKYYVRYMDDAFAVVENKAQAFEIKREMERFISEHLKLTANPKKTKIFPLSQGVNIVGFKTYTTHKLLRDDSKRKMKRKLRKMDSLIASGKMTTEKAEQMINSWHGHARHASSKNFVEKLKCKYDFLSVDRKGTFKINLKG